MFVLYLVKIVVCTTKNKLAPTNSCMTEAYAKLSDFLHGLTNAESKKNNKHPLRTNYWICSLSSAFIAALSNSLCLLVCGNISFVLRVPTFRISTSTTRQFYTGVKHPERTNKLIGFNWKLFSSDFIIRRAIRLSSWCNRVSDWDPVPSDCYFSC